MLTKLGYSPRIDLFKMDQLPWPAKSVDHALSLWRRPAAIPALAGDSARSVRPGLAQLASGLRQRSLFFSTQLAKQR
jgi:hypothetical protein